MKNIILLALVFAQGCSIMPYKEESSCKLNDLGKCLSIEEAYKEAITGNNQGGVLINGETNEVLGNTSITNKAQPLEDNHQSDIYKKIKATVEQKSMPLLKPAVVRRVLIMPYQSKDAQIWNDSRHIYYIEQKPKWLLNKANQVNKTQNYLDIY